MNQKKTEIYSSRNVTFMVGLFFVLFWLLYSIGSAWHQSQKINAEVQAVYQANQAMAEQLAQKQSYIDYLQTPQRIEKDAKTQMNKKLPGEQVIVFVEETIDVLPTEAKRLEKQRIKELPNWQKWQRVFGL